jgi:adenine phosphoribosyltransferase
MLLANKLNVPFIMVRKKGKLPGEVISESYDLEYGSATIEIQKKAIKKGQKIWIHDDVLATGGTAAAAARLIQKQDAQVLGFTFLMELSFLNGRDYLKSLDVPIESLVLY